MLTVDWTISAGAMLISSLLGLLNVLGTITVSYLVKLGRRIEELDKCLDRTRTREDTRHEENVVRLTRIETRQALAVNPPRSENVMRSFIALVTLSTLFSGCALFTHPQPAAAPVVLMAPSDTQPAGDPFDDFILKSGLLAKLLASAKATNAKVDELVALKQISPVKEALARACPNALLIAVPDLQQEAIGLKTAITSIKLPGAGAGPIDPLVALTTLEYGPKLGGGALNIQELIDNARSRIRLVDNGCRGLGVKLVNDFLIAAGRIGLMATGAPAGLAAGSGVLQGVGGLLLRQ